MFLLYYSTEADYWVEILEPESHKIVFANPVTGEMLTERPTDVTV